MCSGQISTALLLVWSVGQVESFSGNELVTSELKKHLIRIFRKYRIRNRIAAISTDFIWFNDAVSRTKTEMSHQFYSESSIGTYLFLLNIQVIHGATGWIMLKVKFIKIHLNQVVHRHFYSISTVLILSIMLRPVRTKQLLLLLLSLSVIT